MGKLGVFSGAFHETESCSKELTRAVLVRGDEGEREGRRTEDVGWVSKVEKECWSIDGAGGRAELSRDWLTIIRGRVELLLLVAGVVVIDDSKEVEGEVKVGVDEGRPFFSPRVSCPSGRDCNCVVVVE
jgi:hypothetical protein